MYEIDKDFVWERMDEHHKRVMAASQAWVTRQQNLIAKRNAGVPPTIGRNFKGEFMGFHAPCDGYIHEWMEGDKTFRQEYMGGQFLPHDKMKEGWIPDTSRSVDKSIFTYVPVEKFHEVEAALREVQDRVPMETKHGRPIYIKIDKGQTFEDRDGTLVCYAYLSKAPKDVVDHVRRALLGEVEDAAEAAAKVAEIADLARQERYDSAPAIAPGRQAFAGEVLATKWKDTDFGPVYKMLVQDDRGFKLWGSVPKNIDPGRGERVAFMATVEPSRDDSRFGFFKRPTKAIILDTEEEVA